MNSLNLKNSGYTLMELLLAVAIGGVLTALAVASFPDMLKNNQMVSDANTLVGQLNLARSEAVKLNRPVAICQSDDSQATTPTCDNTANNWDTGWLIFVDLNGNSLFEPLSGETLFKRGSPSGAIDIVVNNGVIRYGRDGLPASAVVFSLCDSRGISHGRQLMVSVTGRPQISKTFAANTDCTDATP